MKRAKVRFLIETDEENGEDQHVLAVFPETASPGYVECYASCGQRCAAHPDYVRTLKSATKEQYEPLVKEMAAGGYDLEIEERNGGETGA